MHRRPLHVVQLRRHFPRQGGACPFSVDGGEFSGPNRGVSQTQGLPQAVRAPALMAISGSQMFPGGSESLAFLAWVQGSAALGVAARQAAFPLPS